MARSAQQVSQQSDGFVSTDMTQKMKRHYLSVKAKGLLCKGVFPASAFKETRPSQEPLIQVTPKGAAH
ncbi:hypothetical protein SRHO_G00020970 [Serrasalmus rhombeus]